MHEVGANAKAWRRPALVGLVAASLGFWLGRSLGDDGARGSLRATATPRLDASAPPSFAPAVERASPAVVAVRAIVRSAATEQAADELGVRDGSGFLVDGKGLVVTARHLTTQALRLTVDVPSRGPFPAELVGEDAITDLAVLRIDAGPEPMPTLAVGNGGQLRAGDWVVAIGNPFGFKQSVTAGIVSHVGRHLMADGQLTTSEFLQFSAAVNPGSSGCPLVDFRGDLVGVTTQAADSAEGLSFAIPASTMQWVLHAMDQSPDGRVHRGHLGVSFEPPRTTAEGASTGAGAVVWRVLEGHAAAAAGLRRGDIVRTVDGQPVRDSHLLHERITKTPPGSRLLFGVERDGAMLPPMAVELRELPLPAALPGEEPRR